MALLIQTVFCLAYAKCKTREEAWHVLFLLSTSTQVAQAFTYRRREGVVMQLVSDSWACQTLWRNEDVLPSTSHRYWLFGWFSWGGASGWRGHRGAIPAAVKRFDLIWNVDVLSGHHLCEIMKTTNIVQLGRKFRADEGSRHDNHSLQPQSRVNNKQTFQVLPQTPVNHIVTAL